MFVRGLFDMTMDADTFKQLVRDFLVALKEVRWFHRAHALDFLVAEQRKG
jgi:transposase